MGVALLVAGVWGFAEATAFFIVPDVFISFVALRQRRAALWACGAAVAGALLGGAVMHQWGTRDPTGVQAVLERIPAIDREMVEGVTESVHAAGLPALFLGPLSGTPYKIYAAAAGTLGVGLTGFVLVSVPARGIRFVLVALVVAWIAHGPAAAWSRDRKLFVTAAAWTSFYFLYFVVKGL